MPNYVPTTQKAPENAEIDASIMAYLGERRAQALLVLGEPGAGQRDVIRRMEAVARSQSRRTETIRISPGQPPMMFALALAEVLDLHDAPASDSVEFTGSVRAALRALEGPPCSLVLFLHGLEELPAEDISIVESLLGTPPRSSGALVVGVGATRRSDGSPWSGLAALRERAQAQQRCELMELGPVDPEAARELADAILGPGAASQRLITDLNAHAGFLRDDLCDLLYTLEATEATDRLDLLAESRSVQSAPVPARVADRARATVASLEEDARAVASALAVWGRETTDEIVGRLLPETVDVETGLTQLIGRGVTLADPLAPGIDQFVLASPLLARAIYLETPPLQRRRLHRQSAAILEGEPRALSDDEAVALAEHLLEGGQALAEGSDHLFERSARVLTVRARFVDAREQLAGLQERLRHSARGGARHATLPPALATLYAEALTRTGRPAEAHSLLTVLSSGAPEYPQAARRRARDLTAQGKHNEAWAVYEPIVTGATGPVDAHVTQARVEAASVLRLMGRGEEGIAQCELAAREALRSADFRTASRAVIGRYTIERNAARPEEALNAARLALRLARRSGEPSTIARSTSAVGHALSDFSLPRGIRWIRRSVRQATDHGDFSVLSWAGVRYALGEIELGNLDEAERVARRIMHIDGGLHRNRTLPRSHSVVRIVRALRGLDDQAVPAVRFWNGVDRMDMLNALSLEAMAAHAESMAQDDAAAAYQAVTTVVDWFLETRGRERLLLCDLLPKQAEAALRLRDAEALAETIRHFEGLRATTPDFPVSSGGYHQSLGQQALLAGNLDAAVEHLRAAERSFADAGYRTRAAQARQDLAEAHLRRGETELALPLLAETHAFQRRAGTDVRRTRALYRLAGRRAPRERGEGALTEREMQVARLAAQGLTDAEIALTLEITRRTVSTHMHNLRAKLGLRSRREISALPMFNPTGGSGPPPSNPR